MLTILFRLTREPSLAECNPEDGDISEEESTVYADPEENDLVGYKMRCVASAGELGENEGLACKTNAAERLGSTCKKSEALLMPKQPSGVLRRGAGEGGEVEDGREALPE